MAKKAPWIKIEPDSQIPYGRPILLGVRSYGVWQARTETLVPAITTEFILSGMRATHWAEMPSWILAGPPVGKT